MQLFLFSLKMSIITASFYWRNDKPSFVTWLCKLATAPDTPTCNTWWPVHPLNQFVPEIVSPLPCSPTLFRHTLLIVCFFKELISFIGSLDKCHTSVFNALILLWLPWQPEFFMEHNYLKEFEEDHLKNIPLKFGKNPVNSFREVF